ncbi:response regulator transcription factor [Arachidicoccus ginsenosidivorans]|uniref:Response regulator transcription factor n=1 Tax=Arachidicoccus ginsenosidivorans TaxID=496057 RepID=A0A5B8VJP6_9BACT|nr:response regulator transcription factor [Arachidicoccus ginsenosidivorans]QEC70826.1 response regulator transcription factor [Arachidicoccus ginsenosidivorans]
MKILVIEDEPDLLAAIKTSLEKEAYIVESAGDFASASEKLGIYTYDCILLDIMLPGGSGLDLLASLKEADKSENVIIVSAKDSLDDKINGLGLGADDYLTKPFHLAELTARVKAVLRRKQLGGKNSVDVNNVSLLVEERQVMVDDVPMSLNRKEFDLLHYFLLNKSRLITRESLAEHVWGDNIDQADNFDFIYYQIKNLRKKLQAAAAEVEIQAVYGVGYKLITP